MSSPDPKPGERYRHWKSGEVYEVLCVAREESNPSRKHVVYSSEDTQELWVRPLTGWHSNPDHRDPTVLRFTKMNQ